MTKLKLIIVLLAASASACVSGNMYDPAKKFAEMRPVQPMKITGSRLTRMVSPDDPNRQTNSPVSVLTEHDIENSGEINLGDYLQKRVPNMMRDFPTR